MRCLQFQINNHDKVHDERGVFTYKDRWLLVLENYDDLVSLQQFAGNITHLTAIVLNSNQEVSPYFISFVMEILTQNNEFRKV